jgi:hypothetical protein
MASVPTDELSASSSSSSDDSMTPSELREFNKQLYAQYEKTHHVEDVEAIIERKTRTLTTEYSLVWRSSRQKLLIGQRIIYYSLDDGPVCEAAIVKKTPGRIPFVDLRITQTFSSDPAHAVGKIIRNVAGWAVLHTRKNNDAISPSTMADHDFNKRVCVDRE